MTIALSHLKKAVRLTMNRKPRYATFFVNNQCNRQCVYCVVPKNQNLELPAQTWNTITDRVIDWGARLISIVGGEPTLRKDLAEIIKYAGAKAIVNLTSNGDTFAAIRGRDYLRFLSLMGLSTITLSLHDLNDLGRQLDTLQFAQKLSVIPILATVATQDSIEHLPEVMRAANNRGIFFRYSLCQTVGGHFSPATTILRPTPEQTSIFNNIVWQQKQRTGLVINTYEYLRTINSHLHNNWHCHSHKDYWVMVNSDGALMACSEWPTSIMALDILSLSDPRWVETRTAIRLACAGCTNHCYIESEKTNTLGLIHEGMSHAVALFFRRGNP